MLPDANPIALLKAFLLAHAKVEAVPTMLSCAARSSTMRWRCTWNITTPSDHISRWATIHRYRSSDQPS